jgi:hypothetical protein
MITRNQRGWVITLVQHLPLNQTTRSCPGDRHRPVPRPDAHAETITCNSSDTTSLTDEVCAAIARLLGRQAAREWFGAEG